MTVIAACMYDKGIIVGSDRKSEFMFLGKVVDHDKIYHIGDFVVLQRGQSVYDHERGEDMVISEFRRSYMTYLKAEGYGVDFVMQDHINYCVETVAGIWSSLMNMEGFDSHHIVGYLGHTPRLTFCTYRSWEALEDAMAISVGEKNDYRYFDEMPTKDESISFVEDAIRTAIRESPEIFGGIDVRIFERDVSGISVLTSYILENYS